MRFTEDCPKVMCQEGLSGRLLWNDRKPHNLGSEWFLEYRGKLEVVATEMG